MAFKDLFTPEERADIKYWQNVHEEKKEQAESMSDEELARVLEVNLKNLTAIPHYKPGYPVYEAHLVQTLIPEMIRRLREE